ncbi:MAG: hypothetical protein RLZZ34_160, partial [Verrucomicrobiota bacterium]
MWGIPWGQPIPNGYRRVTHLSPKSLWIH